MSSKSQAFATLEIIEADGARSEVIVGFRSNLLAVVGKAMLENDITKMEYLDGLITVALVKGDGTKIKTARILA